MSDTKNKNLRYDLMSNVIHDGKPEAGNFRVQVANKNLNQWYEIQDLHINSILAELVVVSESYIQFYEGYTEKDD